MDGPGRPGMGAAAEDSHRMHTSRSTAGKPRSFAGEGSRPGDAGTPPPSNDSDEHSWEELGSTRIVEHSSTPTPVETPSTQTLAPVKTRTLDAPVGGEPIRLGDFELERKIGEGAMGEVWLARQIGFDRPVALKVLFPHIGNNPKLVARLQREADAMFQLDHPNIVQSYAVGDHEGRHFIALEYVDGHSMQKWLSNLGRLTIGDAIHIVLACARALDYAHKQGMVHRDIKPDNILITTQGAIKVADFGMVKTEDNDLGLTQTGHAVGTPWYMPLEQARNAKDTDGRSDIYALGCMLYCFITGLPPFAGKTLLEVIQAKELGTFPPARQVNAEVPERLDLIIIKMTAKHPKYRYQSCADVIKDLESLHAASARLSFLDQAARLQESGPSAKPLSSHDDPRPAAIVVDPHTWFVRVKDGDGKTAVKKMTTEQVQAMIEADMLQPNAKASHDPRLGFRALATYKEFQGQAFVKASRQSADQRAVRYRTLYKKIEERANQIERDARPKRTDMPPWMPLALKFGGAALGVILVILFFWWLTR